MKMIKTFLLIALSFALIGCGKEEYTGPESVASDQVNTVLNEAFADASDDVKKMVQDILIKYSKEQFTDSMTILQALRSRPDITDNQRSIASRCEMTVADEINRQIRDNKDRKAEQYMRARSANK